jgi:hypothetical protein
MGSHYYCDDLIPFAIGKKKVLQNHNSIYENQHLFKNQITYYSHPHNLYIVSPKFFFLPLLIIQKH